MIAAARQTLGSRTGFGPQAALLASRFDLSHRDETSAMKRTGPFAPHGKIALVSWVIA
jgi:hypothetical protein